MNITDLIDAGLELLPRGGKQLVVVAFAVLCALSAGTATRVVTWYGRQKAHEIVKQLDQLPRPSVSPTRPATPR